MKSQSSKIFKYPIDAITVCALMILFQSNILLLFGYVGNRIGLRDVPHVGTLVFFSIFVITIVSLLVGNYKANIGIDTRKIILPIVICVVNLLSVLYTLLLNKNIFTTVEFDIIQYVVFLPVVVAVFCNIEDYAKLEYWMTVVARFAWIMQFLVIYLDYSRSEGSFESYDMVGGYELIFCSMILLYSVFRKFNILDLLLCLFTFFVALGCGSRGSVLAFVIYFGILLFTKFFKNKNLIFKIAFAVLSLGIILILLLSFNDIVSGLKDYLNELDINTRTLDSLLDSSIVDESNENRKIMYEMVVGSWKNMPVTGHGILYDRLILGTYCHNIVLEIITDYGFFTGVIIILWFVIKTVYSLIYSDSNKKNFIVLLACFVLTQLSVSSSYLITTTLFMLVGTVGITSQGVQNIKSEQVVL